ncbi:hypothetical protein [Levilactobacillus brevis]|uniref:hypothetical protein n=1 Tax=Levilactobacillus brevis TaxID=1580 RepID=UPI0020CB954D|nr:hypothetical protein [Levilactobacillus brevis]MCP9613133.1 hypothetical protein [Levilactobacillus brevis]
MIDDFNTISNKAKSNIEEIAKELNKNGTLEDYDLLVLLVKYMVDLYYFEVHNYQENRAIPQIISRTIMKTYFYVCYLTKGKSDMTEYQIKKEAYKLIARRDEIKKLINSLFNQQLINTNNYKDMIQREKARDLVKEFPELETKLKERKENINDEIKKFLEKNPIDIEPNKFTGFYNVRANYKFNPNKPGIFQWQSVNDVFLMVVD